MVKLTYAQRLVGRFSTCDTIHEAALYLAERKYENMKILKELSFMNHDKGGKKTLYYIPFCLNIYSKYNYNYSHRQNAVASLMEMKEWISQASIL